MDMHIVPFAQLRAQRRWTVEAHVPQVSLPRRAAHALVQLRSLFAVRREFLDPQRHPDHVFNYLSLEHIESLTGDLTHDYAPRPGRQVLSRSKIFREGDILYGRLRPALNKVFVADAGMPEGICSAEFFVLTPDPARILPHFGRALLASRHVQDVVRNQTTGSALPRLHIDDLLEIMAPLPDIRDQRAFEAALLKAQRRRCRIRTELAQGPIDDLEAFATALEDGSVPRFGFRRTPGRPGFHWLRLPAASPARRSITRDS